MYLKKIRIRRMKRIRDLTLELPEVSGTPRPWTVLIGENGTAKTSILQAIALAAAGGSQVNAVMERGVNLMRDRRTDSEPMVVEADFAFTPESRRRRDLHPLIPADLKDVPPLLRSMVRLEPRSTSFVGRADYVLPVGSEPSTEDPLNQARSIHSPLWFVAVYGVARVLPDSSDTPDLSKRSIERLRSLFDHHVQLASVGFANHFRKRDHEAGQKLGTRSRLFAKVLNAILKTGGDDLMPGISGLELRGAGGTKTAADLIDSDRFKMKMGNDQIMIAGVALSHGFQSTFAWIADLVGHILLEADWELGSEEMEGLVLIDEIDLYLHPRWQTTFICALRRVFPRIQFIATTHSPVVLAGLEPSEIVRLAVDSRTGDVRQVGRDPDTGELEPVDSMAKNLAEPDPRAMTGTEVYDDYFGIDRLTLHPDGEKLRAYLALSGDPLRSDRQQDELKKLQVALHRVGIKNLPDPIERESST